MENIIESQTPITALKGLVSPSDFRSDLEVATKAKRQQTSWKDQMGLSVLKIGCGDACLSFEVPTESVAERLFASAPSWNRSLPSPRTIAELVSAKALIPVGDVSTQFEEAIQRYSIRHLLRAINRADIPSLKAIVWKTGGSRGLSSDFHDSQVSDLKNLFWFDYTGKEVPRELAEWLSYAAAPSSSAELLASGLNSSDGPKNVPLTWKSDYEAVTSRVPVLRESSESFEFSPLTISIGKRVLISTHATPLSMVDNAFRFLTKSHGALNIENTKLFLAGLLEQSIEDLSVKARSFIQSTAKWIHDLDVAQGLTIEELISRRRAVFKAHSALREYSTDVHKILDHYLASNDGVNCPDISKNFKNLLGTLGQIDKHGAELDEFMTRISHRITKLAEEKKKEKDEQNKKLSDKATSTINQLTSLLALTAMLQLSPYHYLQVLGTALSAVAAGWKAFVWSRADKKIG